ncbi:MAG TPA: UTP--glucose-1-phosphate uridylyltransferase [Planctomycetaceae bacterium]|nr:UTP--glucose-1-phosphate uridylyltransferase [Planctomycetaceae bacterium]
MSLPGDLSTILRNAGQEHLIAHAEQLASAQRTAFVEQLQTMDWPLVAQLWQTRGQTADVNAAAAEAPQQVVRLPKTDADRAEWQHAHRVGEEALRAGRVAVVVVAGGQGTRLGISFPKGLLPVGPLSQHTLFQRFFEQVCARQQRYGTSIPYAIMTSEATHADTVRALEENQWFGLNSEQVWPFCQGRMPAVDAETGRALLTAPGQLALSPDGHGGILTAMSRAGLLERMRSRGIDTLFYHQIDNPTTIVADPAFLGWHLLREREMSTKVVAKRSAEEKMGVAVDLNGATQVIEYSDLPAELAAVRDAQGQLKFWAGNTAIHAFQREFLEQALNDTHALPFHIAKKAVAHWTPEQASVTPSSPNALKFERFIFDIMPWSKSTLIVEADRAAEFNPIKNNTGADSPETAQAALMALHRSWLRQAGATIADDMPVEISPLVAIEAADLQGRVAPCTVITEPTWLAPDTLPRFPWFRTA